MTEKDKFRVLFAGNMGRAQALDSVIEAAAILDRQFPLIEFVFLGGGLDVERLKARSSALSNVRFLPKVPMDEVGNYLKSASCLLVHLRSDPLFTITIPSKTQAYMAAGKPIIMAVEGDAAALVARAGCGVAVPSENPAALAAAIVDLAGRDTFSLLNMGQSGQKFYAQELSVDKGVNSFALLFRRFNKRA